MKTWKADIVSAIVKEAEGCKIVSLREIATRAGINHVSSGDCRDIIAAVGKKLDGYHPVRMMDTPNDSLFVSVCFIDNTLEFDDGEEFTE